MINKLEEEFYKPITTDIRFNDLRPYKFDYGIMEDGKIIRLIDIEHDLVTKGSMSAEEVNIIVSEYDNKKSYCERHRIKYEIRTKIPNESL